MARLDIFDVEETTRPDINAERAKNFMRLSGDPLENLGILMAELMQLRKQVDEWRASADELNHRLKRIERMLYGGAFSAIVMVAEFLARRFHLTP